MLYSEDDCVISTTEILRRDITVNTRAAIPTIPFMRAGDVEHRHIIQIGDPFHRQAVITLAVADQRARRVRIEGVLIRHGI